MAFPGSKTFFFLYFLTFDFIRLWWYIPVVCFQNYIKKYSLTQQIQVFHALCMWTYTVPWLNKIDVSFNTSDLPAIFIRIFFILTSIFKTISLNLPVLHNLIRIYTFTSSDVITYQLYIHVTVHRNRFLFNHLTPNGHFTGHTAPLTYRCCIFLFIQQIYVRNILNMLHTLRVFLFKMSFIS
jgi:hypothetical protein